MGFNLIHLYFNKKGMVFMNIWSLDNRSDRADMRNLIKNIKSDSDLFAIAGLILNPNVNSSDLSKLFTIVDSESLLNLLKIFGGKTVRIPTIDEVLDEFRFIKLIYCYDFQNMSFSESMRQSGFSESERSELIGKRNSLIERLKMVYNNEHS